MRAAKAVRAAHDTDYQVCAQGNVATSKGTNKMHQRNLANRRVGGTNNDMRAMYARSGAKLCKVITREPDVHMWVNGEMVRVMPTVSTSHTEAPAPASISLAYIIRQAERLEMTIGEYCEHRGITEEMIGD